MHIIVDIEGFVLCAPWIVCKGHPDLITNCETQGDGFAECVPSRRADENEHNTPLGNMVLHWELIACSKTIMLSGCGCFRLNRVGVVLIRKAEKN